MPTVIPLLSALVAGCVHALEMDHMAAVTVFVSRRPHPLRAFGFGVRWALGHSAALLLAGWALVAWGVRPPAAVLSLLEMAVGVMLVGLGLWAVASAARRAAPAGWEVAPTPDRSGHAHRHAHGTTWIGALHGLAGTAGFLALVPATMLATPSLAGGYLLLFGAGTMLAMGLYAAGAGLLIHRAGSAGPRTARYLRVVAGAASVAVGAAWLFGAA